MSVYFSWLAECVNEGNIRLYFTRYQEKKPSGNGLEIGLNFKMDSFVQKDAFLFLLCEAFDLSTKKKYGKMSRNEGKGLVEFLQALGQLVYYRVTPPPPKKKKKKIRQKIYWLQFHLDQHKLLIKVGHTQVLNTIKVKFVLNHHFHPSTRQALFRTANVAISLKI